MPEGLKIVVGGDVTQANAALKKLETQVEKTFSKINSTVGGSGKSFATILPNIQQGASAFKILGEAGQRTGSSLRSLSGVLNTTASTIPTLANNAKVASGSFLKLIGAFGLGNIAGNLLGRAIVAVGEGLFNAITGADKLASATKLLAEAQHKAAESSGEEVLKLQTLFTIAKDVSVSYDKRVAAIDQLNKAYPDLHKNLTLENIETKEVADAVNNLTKALVVRAEVEELTKTIASLNLVGKDLEKTVSKSSNAIRGPLSDALKDIKSRSVDLTKELIRLQTEGLKPLESGDGRKGVNNLRRRVSFFEKPDKSTPEKIDKFIPKFPVVKAAIPMELTIDFDKTKFVLLGGDIKTLQEQMQENINKDIASLIKPVNLKGVEVVFTDAQKLGMATAAAFNAGFQQIAIEGFSTIGEALGTALSGGDIGSVFKGFVDAVGGVLKQIGQQIIAIGVAAILAKKALSVLFENPFAAIAAGVALVAAGAALKGVLKGGVKGFAAGGLVTGPQLALIGEGSGTSRSNPEVVAPLDKLKSMLSGLSGGGKQVVYVRGRLRGNDMILQNARTTRAQGRAGVK